MSRILNVFLAQITFLNKTWYLSDEGFSGQHYYAPFITEPPSLELGPIKGGYVGVKFGKISILNDPYNEFSPFSIYSGGYKSLLNNPNQLIPTKLFYGERETPLFDGNVSLDNFNADTLRFFIENPEFSQLMLDDVRDVSSELVQLSVNSLTKAASNLATVVSPDHGLVTGDLIVVTSVTDSNFNVFNAAVTKVDDSTFTYAAAGASTATSTNHTVQTYEKRPGPLAFGIVNIKEPLIKAEDLDTTGISKGDAFHNPSLDHTSTAHRIKLFDDGVLVGSTDSSHVDANLGSATIAKTGNIVTGTFSGAHGLVAGDQISITGAAPDEFNGQSVIIKAVPSNTTFEYIVTSNEAISDNTITVKKFGNFFGSNRSATASIIFSREQSSGSSSGTVLQGTPAVSGISTHGSTVAEFFTMIKNKLGLSNVDFSRAPNCQTEKLQLYLSSQTSVIDYAGAISNDTNYIMLTTSDTLTLIDRRHTPESFFSFANYEINTATYTMPFPIQAAKSDYEVNVVDLSKSPTSLRKDPRTARVENLFSGEVLEFKNVTDNLTDQKNFLSNLIESETRSQVEITLGFINEEIKVGDRIKTEREEEGVDIDFIVYNIKYNFKNLETIFSGKGTVSIIERETVY